MARCAGDAAGRLRLSSGSSMHHRLHQTPPHRLAVQPISLHYRFAWKGQHRYSHFSHLSMVYIPGITRTLYRRKGGGKGGGGGKSGSGGGSSGTKIQKNFGGLPMGKTSTTAYGNGGGPVSMIQSGFFAGRTAGGGTRDVVFGNRSVQAIFCRPVGIVECFA